jgi:TBC1 domain family member 8/9
MAAVAAQLRNFKEPSKDQLTQLFFSLPNFEETTDNISRDELPEPMEINAVLSLGIAGQEDSYVCLAKPSIKVSCSNY